MCRIIRVLNAVRNSDIAMPLTLRQYQHLKSNNLLDRLVYRKKYGVAVQIAKHLKLSDIGILELWAFYTIKHEKSKTIRANYICTYLSINYIFCCR
jgi:hypothetical protein